MSSADFDPIAENFKRRESSADTSKLHEVILSLSERGKEKNAGKKARSGRKRLRKGGRYG